MKLSPPKQITWFIALALAVLAERAGVPAGVFNVVTGKARVVGAELTSNPVVRKLSFTNTGSYRGHHLACELHRGPVLSWPTGQGQKSRTRNSTTST